MTASHYFMIIAAVVGWYLWLYSTELILPLHQSLFTALLVLPLGILLLAAAVSAFIDYEDPI